MVIRRNNWGCKPEVSVPESQGKQVLELLVSTDSPNYPGISVEEYCNFHKIRPNS